MMSAKYEQYADDMQGIFINIEWNVNRIESQMEEFKKLKLSNEFIDNGIIFIWAEKELIADIVDHFESQGFKYVENLIISQLSMKKIQTYSESEKENLGKRPSLLNFFSQPQKKCASATSNPQTQTAKVEELESTLPNLTRDQILQSFHKDRYDYIGKTKKTLLMFRKTANNRNLELRYQRSSDAVFDFYVDGEKNGIDSKGMECVYRTIETLLPKARDNTELPRLAELFGNESTARPGWLTFFEKK